MGRPKKNVTKFTVNVNSVVLDAIQKKLTLAYTGKVQYGAMSRLTEALFRKWLRGEIQFDPIILDDLDALDLGTLIVNPPYSQAD